MSDSQADFIKSMILNHLGGFKTKRELIENLFIGSLLKSYQRIDKQSANENHLRDRFMKDIHEDESELKRFLDLNELDLSWEKCVFTPELQLARTDITFKTFGIQFILECKRLKSADKAYIDEGLERFINLKYAKGDEYAGMIGFIIAGDKHDISAGLQEKVKSLAHTQSLKRTSLEPFFNSTHQRSDKSQIELYHLFFDFVIS